MLDRGLNSITATAMHANVSIDVVICTYNRAAGLDAVLSALSQQSPAVDVAWSVLVVDNASTDATTDVVDAHSSRQLLPGLRRVRENEQGLTPARRRGVRETSAPWIAFVDDDNLLAPGWLDAIAQAIRLHPDAGAIGGRVVLDWEQPPPAYFKRFGFCFAEQEPGGAPCELSSLVGAGMVVSRKALVECSWLERPLLADRVGKRLISGGDVEIAQRIRGAGYPLWYTPEAVLRHRIPPDRVSWHYLLRVNYGLGGSEALVSALTWLGDWPSWRRSAQRRAVKDMARALLRPQGVVGTLASLSFAIGFTRGVGACITMHLSERRVLLGAAAPNKVGVRRQTTSCAKPAPEIHRHIS
jgi:glucosyl-dolichyl phosphate glucuronosyltransferase